MKPICLFASTERGDPASGIIRFFDLSDISHVGFMRLCDGWTFSAMVDGGVKWRPPNPHAKILLLDTPRVMDMFAMALTKEGAEYNKLAIVGMVFHRNWSNANDEFCNQLVFWTAEGMPDPDPLINPTFIPIQHTWPSDLLKSTKVTKLEIDVKTLPWANPENVQ
jgi:hypothetical protein